MSGKIPVSDAAMSLARTRRGANKAVTGTPDAKAALSGKKVKRTESTEPTGLPPTPATPLKKKVRAFPLARSSPPFFCAPAKPHTKQSLPNPMQKKESAAGAPAPSMPIAVEEVEGAEEAAETRVEVTERVLSLEQKLRDLKGELKKAMLLIKDLPDSKVAMGDEELPGEDTMPRLRHILPHSRVAMVDEELHGEDIMPGLRDINPDPATGGGRAEHPTSYRGSYGVSVSNTA